MCHLRLETEALEGAGFSAVFVEVQGDEPNAQKAFGGTNGASFETLKSPGQLKLFDNKDY